MLALSVVDLGFNIKDYKIKLSVLHILWLDICWKITHLVFNNKYSLCIAELTYMDHNPLSWVFRHYTFLNRQLHLKLHHRKQTELHVTWSFAPVFLILFFFFDFWGFPEPNKDFQYGADRCTHLWSTTLIEY